MSQAIPPSSSLPPVTATVPTAPPSSSTGSGQSAANFAPAATAAGVPAPAVPSSGAVQAAQVASIVAAAQAALAKTVNLSPQAQQAVKFEAFNQLVGNLVNQIQPGQATLPSNWPAGGITPALHNMVSALLQQATAGQPLPQQLVSVQSWPTALTQAVLQHAGQQPPLPQGQPSASAGAAPPAAAHAGLGAPTIAAGVLAAGARAPLPQLQAWLVQQGVVQAQDGERGFTLTLRVPVAWAQAQSALGSALPAGATSASGAMAPSAPAAGLVLPFSGSVQQLANGSMGLVMQPHAIAGSVAAASAQAMRTSALLQLEFQPLAQSLQQAQAASVYLPGHMLPSEVQAMLQGRGQDPWLLMAQAHADQAHGKPAKHAGEQAGLCNVAGCQYEGRAICAQPFCAEMNYLWAVARAQRRS